MFVNDCSTIRTFRIIIHVTMTIYYGSPVSALFYVLHRLRNYAHLFTHSRQYSPCSSTPCRPFLQSSSQSFSYSGTTPHGQPMNTHLCPSGSKEETTSHYFNVNNVMRLSTLRNLITLVSCQLQRLRLLPTAQSIKAGLDIKREVVEARSKQSQNAPLSTFHKECGVRCV